MSDRSVFHDPSGRRALAVRWGVRSAAVAALVLAGSFAWAVWRPPQVTPLPLSAAAARATPTPPPSLAAARRARPIAPAGAGAPARSGSPSPSTTGSASTARPARDPIVAGFLVQWDPGSRAALDRFGDRMDWVVVEGGFLGRGAPGALTIALDPDLVASARRRDVALHLMLTNYHAGAFDPRLVEGLLRTPERRARAVATIVEAVDAHGLAGITLDFERLVASQHAEVLGFLRALRTALGARGTTLTVALPVADGAEYPVAAYGAAADYVVPMLYDEHAGSSEPGPVAGARWFAERLAGVAALVPPHKLLAGLGQYGYHWRADRPSGVTVSVSEAMALARGAPDGPTFDPGSRTPTARWRDARGLEHTVWYLDAVTAWNQVRSAMAAGTAGIALWRLGAEDASLWRVLGRRGVADDPTPLEALPSDGVAVLEGEGEVLAVEGRTGDGRRQLRRDATGAITDERVVVPPGGYVVTRAGDGGRRVALTFDDGPDPAWTAAILDTLAAREAVASFFVIGRQVQQFPDLTRRIADAGHEIGNHTFSHPDLAGLSETAVQVELAAAGRVIEAVTGRRPLLFRPPYIGDARPATAERLRPMAVASTLGYRTAGLEIDTRDWQLADPAAIVARALRGLDEGRIILLHDGGGDRTATVAAVGPLVDSLRARGFTLTTVAGLLGVAPDAGSPPVPAAEAPQRLLNLGAITIWNVAERVLVTLFLVALVLGVVRAGGIVTLAAVERARPRFARRARDADFTPAVSILVPAYNEGRVIARTVHSLRRQGWPRLEILVIDDGSRDDTAEQAIAAAGADPRVRVLRQPNGGKAAALNTGIAAATGEIVVIVDADTILEAEAIRHLVRPLADRRVGAVAGNAKVGNRVNLVTRWQGVEYVTSQNLDRRAFALLNCVTVVPGAIGAWRRDAVLAAGGFRTDTLAEDQDLTLTLLRAGHRVALADRAIAWTEAPETLGALLAQRFRWSFGTLQCAWKHRGALFRREAGALGLVGLPNVWLFQLLFPLLAPAADLALLATLARYLVEAPALGAHAAWGHAAPIVGLYALFLALDVATAVVGLALERGESVAQALLVPLQRIAYRQVLYVALLKAMRAAAKGWAPGWNKLDRTGRVAERAFDRAPMAG